MEQEICRCTHVDSNMRRAIGGSGKVENTFLNHGRLNSQAWLQDAVGPEKVIICRVLTENCNRRGDVMLVLGMKPGEHIMIGDQIMVKVVRSEKGDLRLAIDAPAEIKITRGDLNDVSQDLACE